MAIISMSDYDPSKRVDKKWVAKATIGRVVEIKDKQVLDAVCAREVAEAELELNKSLLMITDKEMRYQTHMKTIWMIIAMLLFVAVVGLSVKVING